MPKIVFVPGFFENPWMPRYKKFRQEFEQQHPEVNLDIVKMHWFLRVMTNYVETTYRALQQHKPEVAGGFSYGANAVLIAAATMDRKDRPKKLVLASISDNFAEPLDKSEWHTETMENDLKRYHIDDIADEIRETTETYVLATDKEIAQNLPFGRHINRATKRLSKQKEPIIVKSGTLHPFNMASKLYRQKIIDLLSES